MNHYNEFDASKGVCDTCNKLVSTTFKLAPITYNGNTFNDILQGFCDTCGACVSIPHQSINKLNKCV